MIRAPPLGTISFIFMQFLTKILSKTQNSWVGTPIWEILDPPWLVALLLQSQVIVIFSKSSKSKSHLMQI